MGSASSPVSLRFDGELAIVCVNSPPVNALSHAVRAGLVECLGGAVQSDARAIVLYCEGRTFFAGADISEFGKPPEAPTLGEVIAACEQSPLPIVAAIHGSALGGGLELAMACDYRVAVKSARLGLPEVKLGLLPGAGGTQRLPRLVGVERAIDIIVSGKPVGANAAEAMGLIDAGLPDGELLPAACGFAREIAGRTRPVELRQRGVDLNAEQARAAAERYRAAHPKRFRGFKAPAAILEAVTASAYRSFDDAISLERTLFADLIERTESAAQRYAFRAERACAKIPGLDRAAAARPVEEVGIVGAGTMGTGIALALLAAGYRVRLYDRSEDAIGAGSARIAQTIARQVKKGRITSEQAKDRTARLSTATDAGALSASELIIEAVFESMPVKRAVFEELDAIAKPGAILASNTSFLDIEELASATGRPDDIVGLHFFAPADVMRLLEIVRTSATADAVLATGLDLARKLGKLGVVSRVCDGFIANRVMAQRRNAANRLLLQGATPQQIDRVMEDYGFPMGPYRMLDLVGLDVGWDREGSAARTVQEILCEAGDFGQKSGRGYYNYAGDKPVPSQRAIDAIAAVSKNSGRTRADWNDRDIRDYCLDSVINEAAMLLDEDIVIRASDIDMAVIAGYGWPVYHGGPMFFADTIGIADIHERLQRRVEQGERLKIADSLARRAKQGGTFVR